MSKRKEPSKGASQKKGSRATKPGGTPATPTSEEARPASPASDAPPPSRTSDVLVEEVARVPVDLVDVVDPVDRVDTVDSGAAVTRRASESLPTTPLRPVRPDALAKGRAGLLPDWAGPRLRLATPILLVLLLALSWGAPWLTRTVILARQRALPESDVPLALEDLEAGRDARALQRVRRLLDDARIVRFEGRGESAAAIDEQRLADILASRGFRPEARAMALRAALAYHQENRALEDLPTWTTYARACAPDDPARMLEALGILLGHGRLAADAAVARLEGVSDPFRARLGAWAESRRRLVNLPAASALSAAAVDWPEWKPKEAAAFGSSARCAIDAVRARALARAGRGDEAKAIATTLRTAHPDRLEPEFLAATLAGGEAPREYLASLDARPDLAVFDMGGLDPVASSTLPAARLAKRGATGKVVATASAAGAMEMRVRLDRAAPRFYLVASGSDLLGVHPIVLVTVEGAETWPVHVAASSPAPFALEIPLAAGSHLIRIEYINDSAVRIGEANHDRNLTLHRIVFPADSGSDS